MRPAQLRRRFLSAFWYEARVVWPILSGVVVIQLVLGILVGYLEGWRMGEDAYFQFVTGLTIGYGDLVPVRMLARVIAVVIGLCGILLTGLIAAIGVRALQAATEHETRR